VTRSWLFVPGNRPGRFEKAASSGSDEVICDLEDAVDDANKETARRDVAEWLAGTGSAWVRVNAVGTPFHADDVASLAGLPGVRGFVVPKAEEPDALLGIGDRLGRPHAVVALIETAVGVHNAVAIARCGVIDRLAFGSIDYADDIRADESPDALLVARSTLVLASRVADVPAPIDGVTTRFDDPAEVTADAVRARGLGFGGKLCIHPAQIAPVHAAFRPSADDERWAREVLAADNGSGAASLHGRMIDRPVLERARSILAELGD
jgi:citrate lyase subunit beta/citryl-CoA lyase